MMRVKKFSFDRAIDMFFVEAEVVRAILTTENVFGSSRVKSSVKYCLSANKVVMYVFNDIGGHVFDLFRRRIDQVIGRGRYSFQERGSEHRKESYA